MVQYLTVHSTVVVRLRGLFPFWQYSFHSWSDWLCEHEHEATISGNGSHWGGMYPSVHVVGQDQGVVRHRKRGPGCGRKTEDGRSGALLKMSLRSRRRKEVYWQRHAVSIGGLAQRAGGVGACKRGTQCECPAAALAKIRVDLIQYLHSGVHRAKQRAKRNSCGFASSGEDPKALWASIIFTDHCIRGDHGNKALIGRAGFDRLSKNALNRESLTVDARWQLCRSRGCDWGLADDAIGEKGYGRAVLFHAPRLGLALICDITDFDPAQRGTCLVAPFL